jgi:hypothetical protein
MNKPNPNSREGHFEIMNKLSEVIKNGNVNLNNISTTSDNTGYYCFCHPTSTTPNPNCPIHGVPASDDMDSMLTRLKKKAEDKKITIENRLLELENKIEEQDKLLNQLIEIINGYKDINRT